MNKSPLEVVRKYPATITALSAGAVLLGSVGYQLASQPNSPRQTYEKHFTDKGDCLDGTPYDPSNGAVMNVNKEHGQDILSVLPQAANSYTPSVLLFTAKDGHINFADHQTGGFLVESGCIAANSGQ